MATQPIIPIVPSVQAPQTNCGVLQQTGSPILTTGEMPGEQPNLLVHMARAQLISNFSLTSDDAVGTAIFGGGETDPMFPNVVYTAFFGTLWGSFALTAQNYFSQTTYWNADVVLHFWAIKPPQSVGRLRIVYTPPEFSTFIDPSQRQITKEWDLSATNIFEFVIPSYNLRSYRNCVANYAPLNGLDSTFRAPYSDYKVGRISVFVTHIYQPGSIFPQNCNIMVFQSFQNPQFSTVVGPAVPVQRSALTTLNVIT